MSKEFSFLDSFGKITGTFRLDKKWGILLNLYVPRILLLLATFSGVIDAVVNSSNLEKVIHNLPVTSCLIVTLSFSIEILLYKKKFQEFLHALDTTIRTKRIFLEQYKFKGNYIQRTDSVDKVIKVFISLCCIIALQWMAYPIVTGRWGLPLAIYWFPFNLDNYYWLAYFFQCLTIITVMGQLMLTDSIVIKSISMICREFAILKHSLQHVQPSPNTYETIKKCINYHQSILELCDKQQEFLSRIIMFRYVYSAVNFSFISYSIIIINELNGDCINLLCWLAITCNVLFIYCWLGSELFFHADNVTLGIWNSKWLDFDTKSKKLCLFMMVRERRGVYLKAISIVPLGLKQFVWVLKHSFSNITVLRQMSQSSRLD